LNNFNLIIKREKYFASLFLLYTKSFGVKLEPMPANVLGFLLCIYGVFRLVRAFIRLRKERRDEE